MICDSMRFSEVFDRMVLRASTRARTVWPTFSVMSASEPPVCCEMSTAVANRRRSRLPVRSATLSSASGTGVPARMSEARRLNSDLMGSLMFSATGPMAWATDEPARRFDAMSGIAWPSCSSNFFLPESRRALR